MVLKIRSVQSDDPRRYQLIINGLRAELVEKLVDWERSNARASALQNRLLKSLSGLAALDQHETHYPLMERDDIA